MKGLGSFPTYIKPTPPPRERTVPLTMKDVIYDLIRSDENWRNVCRDIVNFSLTLESAAVWCKARYGRALLFEPVYVKYGYCGARVIALGRILFIAQNVGHRLLQHYPEREMCLLIHWHTVDKDHFVPPFPATIWESADRFVRCFNGDGPPWPGLWSMR